MTETPSPANADIVALVERAAAATHPIVAAVRPDQWGLPTPCTEWDTEAVARHLLHGVRIYLTGFGETAGDDPEPARDDLAPAIAAADARFLAALRQPDALGRTLKLPFGEMPAATVVGYRFVDLLVHGWDLAKATGQPTDFAPDLHDAALALSQAALEHFDRSAFPMFADEQPAPTGCSSADRLAAFLGRAV